MSDTAKIVTPAGPAVWACLSNPDYTHKKDQGEFTAKIRLTPEESAPIRATLDALYDKAREIYGQKFPKIKPENYKDSGHRGYTEETDEAGDKTGMYLIGMRMNYSGQRADGSDWTQRPTVVDAKTNPIDPEVEVGRGSTLRLSGQAYAFANNGLGYGVGVRLKGVQVLNLVEYGDSPAALGFEAEEDEDADFMAEKDSSGDGADF